MPHKRVAIIAACTLAIASAAAAPSPWVLLKRFPDITVYIDSTRVERTRPDTSVGTWLMWISDTFIPGDTTPMATPVKKIIVHAGVRCAERRVRALETDVYDPNGTRVARHEFTATDSLRPQFNKMVYNVFPAVCAWLGRI